MIGHDATNLTEGYGGPRDPSVLSTTDDVVAELGDLVVERAETVRRVVALEDREATALDAFVRVVRPG